MARRGGAARGETRVRSFAVLPPSGPELRAKLESLRRRQAAVVVWGGRSEHRQVMVTAGSYESMRAEALASLAAAGLRTSGVWADIAPATPADDRAARRPVVVSMASASEVSEALQPLRDAGHPAADGDDAGDRARARWRGCGRRSPCPAPSSRTSRSTSRSRASRWCRNGVLLAARDLPWGYVDENYAHRDPRSREDITALLADAISGFVAEIGGSPADIGQVCVCGGLSDLRSMSTALMERLDVEVEPLDSLFGIDAARLPEPADEFRERGRRAAAGMGGGRRLAADDQPAARAPATGIEDVAGARRGGRRCRGWDWAAAGGWSSAAASGRRPRRGWRRAARRADEGLRRRNRRWRGSRRRSSRTGRRPRRHNRPS